MIKNLQLNRRQHQQQQQQRKHFKLFALPFVVLIYVDYICRFHLNFKTLLHSVIYIVLLRLCRALHFHEFRGFASNTTPLYTTANIDADTLTTQNPQHPAIKIHHTF